MFGINSLYMKIVGLFALCMLFLIYYFNSMDIRGEIKADNNIEMWNNELLEDTKNEILRKTFRLEYCKNLFASLPDDHQIMDYLATLGVSAKELDDFEVSVVSRKESNDMCLQGVCLLWDDVQVNFTYVNDDQFFSLMHNINSTDGVVILLMDVKRSNQDQMFVKLLLRSYYKG